MITRTCNARSSKYGSTTDHKPNCHIPGAVQIPACLPTVSSDPPIAHAPLESFAAVSDGRRDRRDHAGGRCHDPRGPSGPRATASLLDSGRNADGSNTRPDKADAPIVPQPSDSDDRMEPSTLRPIRNLGLE